MADAILSGYKEAAQTALSTGLNSLADATWASLSSAIDNSTSKYMMMDIEVVLASAAFTGADSAVEIYVVPSVDDTNYPTFQESGTADEQENNQYYVGSVTTTGATAAQRMVLRNVACPNGLFKIGIRNQTGVAFAASGNTVKYRRHQYSSA